MLDITQTLEDLPRCTARAYDRFRKLMVKALMSVFD
jgi:hypothetical protein